MFVNTPLVPPMLPTLALPVTVKVVSDPNDVTLGCAAVVKVPVTKEPLRLPPVMLPVADINPVVTTLPADMLPVAVTLPLIDTRLLVLLKVKAADPAKRPLSLN